MALPDPQQHRVLAMLSLPRSAAELGRQLDADPFAPFEKTDLVNQASAVLAALAAPGYAVQLGSFDTADDALAAIAADATLVAMPAEKAANWTDAINGPDAFKLTEGPLWYWTTAGHDALLS
jgi:hypothetical protein